jgi:hypothetical protein
MKNLTKESLIKTLYWFFRIGYWFHLALIIILFLFDYFFINEKGLYFTVRGNFNLSEENWRPTKDFNYIVKDTSAEPVVLLGKSGWARIDYYDFSNAFTPRNVGITLADMLWFILSLTITFQLMKILKSIMQKNVFDDYNIRRLRWIAFAVGLMPICESFQKYWFSQVIQQSINFSKYFVIVKRGLFVGEITQGLIMMILILVLIEIFRFGINLKQENDLTI